VSELQGLQLGLSELRARGVVVAGVVVDPVATNAQLARDAGLEFPLLADPDLRTIDAYGLRHARGGPDGGDIAHSASVLIDADGVVRWVFVTRNFRVRPTVPDVLAAAAALSRAR
jgi:peroxiredoxin